MSIDLFGDLSSPEGTTVGDPFTILQSLAGTCRDCRLGQTADRSNTGFVIQGPVKAEVAILGDAPDYAGTTTPQRLPLAGDSLYTLRNWLKKLDQISAEKKYPCRSLEEEDILFLNTVQCRTQKTKKEAFREPHPDEIRTCFARRALPFLQSLPNLRVLITLGMPAAAAILGSDPEPSVKSHEGAWFGTDYLPRVAVFCLSHPREFDEETEARRLGRLQQCLKFFHSEYVDDSTAKILEIQNRREAQRARLLADQ
jgi:uracil-DNA glycosylase